MKRFTYITIMVLLLAAAFAAGQDKTKQTQSGCATIASGNNVWTLSNGKWDDPDVREKLIKINPFLGEFDRQFITAKDQDGILIWPGERVCGLDEVAAQLVPIPEETRGITHAHAPATPPAPISQAKSEGVSPFLWVLAAFAIVLLLAWARRRNERRLSQQEPASSPAEEPEPALDGPPMLTGGFTGLIGDPDEHEEVSQHLVNTVAPAVFAEAGMSCKRMKIVGPVEYGAVTGHAVIMYGDGSRKLKELTDEPCYRALVENDGGERKFVHALYICANGLIRDELEGDDFVFAPTRSIEKPEPGPEPEPEYRVTETNGSVIISNANGQSIVIALPEEMRLVFQRDDRICISVVGFPNINVELPMGNVRADLLPLAEPDQSEPETEMQTGPGPENPVMVETGDDAPPVLLGMGANGTSSENREDLPAGEFSRN